MNLVVKASKDTQDNGEKNAKIARTIKETRERRLTQTCKVFQLKIDSGYISSIQREALNGAFLESKWIYNDALNQEFPEKYIPGNKVSVKKFSGEFESRDIKFLGSQMKQSIIDSLKDNLKSLKKLKDNGRKTGKLKFIRQYNSINLKQYGVTYNIFANKSQISIQKIPGRLRVHGLHQLTDNMEFANAKLVKKPSGYYLFVTTYTNNELIVDTFVPGTAVGIDMGVADHITLSSGEKVNATVPESPRLKRIQRSLGRQYKHAKKVQKDTGADTLKLSKNYYKNLKLLHAEYEKMNNVKDNLANQVVSRILKNEHVFFQDEALTSWKVRSGKRLQHSILGRVKSKLIIHPRTYMIDRMTPTTQWCNECEGKTKHLPNKRMYVCQFCGETDDRDIHAAKNMILLGIKEHNVPVDSGELTSVPANEGDTLKELGVIISDCVRGLEQSPLGDSSVKQEAYQSLAGG